MHLDKQELKHYIAIGVIIIMHIVGVFGLNSTHHEAFAELTPINLFVTFLALLFTTQFRSKAFWLFFTFAFIVGMLVEIIGVKTGFPFGTYYYPPLLSFQLFEVPVLIGINWFILSYIIISFIHALKLKNFLLKVILAALIMTGLDIIIEPFAIKHGLWVWENSIVPLRNYIAWFVISSIIFIFGFQIQKEFVNKTAISTLIIYLIFFSLNLSF